MVSNKIINKIDKITNQFQNLMNSQKNTTPSNTSSITNNTEEVELNNSSKIYIVQTGDTLSEIAQNNNINLEELISYNNIYPSNMNHISIGQEIKIPIKKQEKPLTKQSNNIIKNIIMEDVILKKYNKKIMNKIINNKLTDEEYKKYSNIFNDFLAKHSKTKRERTAAAAIFLTTMFPKLPYFWGGGHNETPKELTGINQNWGMQDTIISGGDDKYILGSQWPKSLDCSGFVSWCLINGGNTLDHCYNTFDFRNHGTVHQITERGIINKVHVGDLADEVKGTEHVGIIVDVNKDGNTITVAHCSGSGEGMNLTTIDTNSGIVIKDEIGPTGKSRVGNVYFKNVVLWNYDDEQKNVHTVQE